MLEKILKLEVSVVPASFSTHVSRVTALIGLVYLYDLPLVLRIRRVALSQPQRLNR